ncbi:MAG TPA: GatB/YqeY domain-containing protein [Burkholderiales bacterium]|nr:GatB/YqeY domain-containing protein [Burkholderiales bacterium]
MKLKERIVEDMKAALRAKETARLSALRLLLAAIKQREVDERVELGDAEVVAVIDKMLKQRRDSISQFQAAGRQDLVAAEEHEVQVLTGYLPARLSPAEIEATVTQAIAAAGAKSAQDMGKVMSALKRELTGRADMAQVSALVKEALTKLAG